MLRSTVSGACMPLLDRMPTLTQLHSFVQLESNETKMYIDWSGTSKQIDKLPSVTLCIPREHDGGSAVLNGEGGVLWR